MPTQPEPRTKQINFRIEPDGDDVRFLVPSWNSDAQFIDALIAVVKSPIFAMRSFEPAGK